VEGVDYTVDGNVIKRISRGSMPYADMSYVYSDTPAGVSIKVESERCPDYDYDGATEYLTYGEKDTYTRKQIVVTYTRTNGWQGEIPEGKRDRFSKLNAKLEAGEDVNIVVYGDSISEGCNASGTSYGGNVAPYADSWADMVTKKLAKDYGANVRLRNVALGGKATDWATQNFDERVLSEDADLLILGFGMNDGGTSVDTYRERIEEMVVKFRQHNPDGEVLLLAPMLPNVESTWLKNQPLFAEELYTLEDKYGYAAVADMTAMHWELLNMGKRYRDMTGNNINHPNDFMVRIYGQVILHTLLNSQA
jgi:lysophospholipase L1-like esterase